MLVSPFQDCPPHPSLPSVAQAKKKAEAIARNGAGVGMPNFKYQTMNPTITAEAIDRNEIPSARRRSVTRFFNFASASARCSCLRSELAS